METESIFLITKFAISLVIGLSSAAAIVFGFKLVAKHRSGIKPQNSLIQFAGLKAEVSSLGALMIVAGILLAIVSVQILPKTFKKEADGAITIAKLKSELKTTEAMWVQSKTTLGVVQDELAEVKEQIVKSEAIQQQNGDLELKLLAYEQEIRQLKQEMESKLLVIEQLEGGLVLIGDERNRLLDQERARLATLKVPDDKSKLVETLAEREAQLAKILKEMEALKKENQQLNNRGKGAADKE